jgi:hypothetical protein
MLTTEDGTTGGCPYNARHADPAVAQGRVDGLGAVLDSDLLAAVRRAEFFVLLRRGESAHCGRVVVGERAFVFVAGGWVASLPDAVLRRFSGRAAIRKTSDRRDRVHVRSRVAAACSAAELVSCGDSGVVAVGDLAIGIRSARVQVTDTHLLGSGDDQSFLATADGCELGAGIVFSRTEGDAGVVVFVGISGGGSVGGVLADAPGVDVVGGENRVTSS